MSIHIFAICLFDHLIFCCHSLFYSFIDLIRALPSTLMALLVIVGLGSGTTQLMIATGVAFSPLIAYVTRSVYLREASRDYVLAARTFGGSRWHLLRFHILPNISGALLTQAAIVLISMNTYPVKASLV